MQACSTATISASCQDRATCDSVCRNKPEQFFERYVEIGGFELKSTPRVDTVAIPELPSVIPLIGHKYSRKTVLNELVVAVPLYELFHMRSGQPHVRTRAELAARFRILETATVVASGVDRDAKLEAWWAFADRALIMSTLRDLGIALVSVPNFSLFLNVPRPDNLHSMKRIALGWAELMAAGFRRRCTSTRGPIRTMHAGCASCGSARKSRSSPSISHRRWRPEPHRLACRSSLPDR